MFDYTLQEPTEENILALFKKYPNMYFELDVLKEYFYGSSNQIGKVLRSITKIIEKSRGNRSSFILPIIKKEKYIGQIATSRTFSKKTEYKGFPKHVQERLTPYRERHSLAGIDIIKEEE